jgi:hypothetical protein
LLVVVDALNVAVNRAAAPGTMTVVTEAVKKVARSVPDPLTMTNGEVEAVNVAARVAVAGRSVIDVAAEALNVTWRVAVGEILDPANPWPRYA